MARRRVAPIQQCFVLGVPLESGVPFVRTNQSIPARMPTGDALERCTYLPTEMALAISPTVSDALEIVLEFRPPGWWNGLAVSGE